MRGGGAGGRRALRGRCGDGLRAATLRAAAAVGRPPRRPGPADAVTAPERAAAGAGGCGLGPWHRRCRCSRPCPAPAGPAGAVPYRSPVPSAVRPAAPISFRCSRFVLSSPLLFLSFLPSFSARVTVCLSFFPCCGLSLFFLKLLFPFSFISFSFCSSVFVWVFFPLSLSLISCLLLLSFVHVPVLTVSFWFFAGFVSLSFHFYFFSFLSVFPQLLL